MGEAVRTDYIVSNMPIVRVLPKTMKKKAPNLELNIPSARGNHQGSMMSNSQP